MSGFDKTLFYEEIVKRNHEPVIIKVEVYLTLNNNLKN